MRLRNPALRFNGGCALSGLLPDWTSSDVAGPEPAYRFLIANKLKDVSAVLYVLKSALAQWPQVKMKEQSIRFGTKVVSETVSKLDLSRRPFKYWLEGREDEEPNTANAIILATGASAKRLSLPGEETYWQSGISACAVCDGAVCVHILLKLKNSANII